MQKAGTATCRGGRPCLGAFQPGTLGADILEWWVLNVSLPKSVSHRDC